MRSVLAALVDRKRLWLLFPIVVLGGAVGDPSPAAAQTAASTVTDQEGRTVLQVLKGGGLLAPGTFGTGVMPTGGPGTRLMWIPAKAAFRAGRVGFGMSDGTEWNVPNVGPYSVAFGVGTEAGGQGAVAMGQGATATGSEAVAMGYRTTASGLRASAFGDLTTASGNFSSAFGLHTTARATASVAFGRWNVRAGRPGTWRSGDPLLVAGNGSGPSDRSNALLLRKNGDLTIAGTLTEHSDRRLKTDVRPLGTVGAALDRLRPVRFRFSEQTGHPTTTQIGLLAQDVRAEFPSLVRKGPDGFLSLAYPKLTAVLLKGLQEQRARIDSLQRRLDRVERLERQQRQLAEQVAALKARQSQAHSSSLLGGLEARTGIGLLLFVLGGLVGVLMGRRGGEGRRTGGLLSF